MLVPSTKGGHGAPTEALYRSGFCMAGRQHVQRRPRKINEGTDAFTANPYFVGAFDGLDDADEAKTPDDYPARAGGFC